MYPFSAPLKTSENLTVFGCFWGVEKGCIALHKKRSFPLRIFSVNLTKSADSCDLVTFTEEIPNAKLHFLCNGGYKWVNVGNLIQLAFCVELFNGLFRRGIIDEISHCDTPFNGFDKTFCQLQTISRLECTFCSFWKLVDSQLKYPVSIFPIRDCICVMCKKMCFNATLFEEVRNYTFRNVIWFIIAIFTISLDRNSHAFYFLLLKCLLL